MVKVKSKDTRFYRKGYSDLSKLATWLQMNPGPKGREKGVTTSQVSRLSVREFPPTVVVFRPPNNLLEGFSSLSLDETNERKKNRFTFFLLFPRTGLKKHNPSILPYTGP